MEPIKYGAQSQDGPSGLIWNDCPWSSIKSGREPGFAFEDDFESLNASTTAKAARWLIVQEASGATFAMIDTILGGVVQIDGGATDNDQILMGLSNAGGAFKVVRDSGAKMWFEARIATDIITASSMMIGLINAVDVAMDLMADTQTDAAILDTSEPDFLGFIESGDSTAAGLDAIYMDQATTNAHIIHKADAQTLVAATYYKLGMYFDGGTIFRFFVDNVQQGDDLDPNSAEFPDGEELTIVFAAKNAAGTAKKLSIDWVRAAQLRV